MALTEKYVSVSGAGSHDGSSEANAWTLAEAIAAPVGAGCRCNIKSGTYTLGSSITIPSGGTESQIEWRGYNSTIGDLLAVGRDGATGEIVDTNFPVIDCGSSYYVIPGGDTTFKNLTFTGSRNGALLYFNSASYVNHFYRCRFEHTNTSQAGPTLLAYDADNRLSSFVDCDILMASTNAALVGVSVGRLQFIGNRVWHSGSPHVSSKAFTINNAGIVSHNVIFNFGVAVSVDAVGAPLVAFNSIYNVATGIRLNDTGFACIGNIVYDVSDYLFGGSTNNGNPFLLSNASDAATRIDTSTIGSNIFEVDPISLSGSPFTNAASGDFTLNNTAGAGADCKAALSLWGGFSDLGAIQSESIGGTLLTGLKRGIRL